MELSKKFREGNSLLIIVMLIIVSIGIIHFVFFFFINETEYLNILDSMESSPLFDFNINSDCGPKSQNIFHVWGGWIEVTSRSGVNNKRSKIKVKYYDETNITKLNGKNFCYKHVSYKELLDNGQIRKVEEQYNGDYSKDCGIIDTLNQHLFIKDGEECPLYDTGIGSRPDTTNYVGDTSSNLYYNNDNYNIANKKIIGKLILSDGQPCYKLNETLWRKFHDKEADEEHLKCETEVFGKINDDKFRHKGDITYDQIYKDNLSNENYILLKDQLNGLKVSLYSREFLGIDKECDKKNEISKDMMEKITKYQTNEKIYSIIEGCIIIGVLFPIILIIIIKKVKFFYMLQTFFFLSPILFLISLIFHSIYLGKLIQNDVSYNCSDDITNELTKIQNKSTKNSILFTAINLGLDILVFLFVFSIELILCITKKNNEEENPNSPFQPNIKDANFGSNSAQDKYNSGGVSKEPEMKVNVYN